MPIALLIFLGVFIAVSFLLLFAVCLCKAAGKPIPSPMDPINGTTSNAPPGPPYGDSLDRKRGADSFDPTLCRAGSIPALKLEKAAGPQRQQGGGSVYDTPTKSRRTLPVR